MTRVNKPSTQMVTPNLAPPTLERTAQPNAGYAVRLPATTLAARFQQDQRGSTAIMFGLLIMPVMFLTGMAVDYSRMITAKSRMQTAIDAAALAGVRAAQMNTSNQNSATVIEAAAQKFYDGITASLRDSRDAVNSAASNKIAMAVQTDGSYKFTVSSWIRTPFLSIAHGAQPDGSAPSGCATNKFKCQKISTTASILAQSGGNNTGYSIETSLMLDITGSMSGQKLTDLKAAANDAIDLLIWEDQSTQTSRIAIAPFAQDVRLPTAAAFQAATGQAPVTASKSVYGYTFGTKNNEYCVGERTGTNKYTDVAPSAGNYVMVEWMYSNWGVQCDVPTTAKVQPLTTDKTVLHNLINGLQTAGGTAGHMGTAWAWYTLSPNWNALWSATNAAAAYDTAYNINTKVGNPKNVTLRKIAVLMTDGDYNTQFASGGILTSYFGDAAVNDSSNNQASSLCTGMKAKGIEVYTVAFGTGISNGSKTLLTNCATDPSHFYDASTGDALKAAFRDIAMKIAKIRVSG